MICMDTRGPCNAGADFPTVCGHSGADKRATYLWLHHQKLVRAESPFILLHSAAHFQLATPGNYTVHNLPFMSKACASRAGLYSEPMHRDLRLALRVTMVMSS